MESFAGKKFFSNCQLLFAGQREVDLDCGLALHDSWKGFCEIGFRKGVEKFGEVVMCPFETFLLLFFCLFLEQIFFLVRLAELPEVQKHFKIFCVDCQQEGEYLRLLW